MEGELLPRLPPPSSGTEQAKEGEYVRVDSIGLGDLNSPHTDGRAPEELRGKADKLDIDNVTPEWVLRRLVAEANDFGTRTRQSSRVKALELLGKHFAMFTEVVVQKDPVREALANLDPFERRQRIAEFALRIANDPNYANVVATAAAKGK